MKQAPGCHDTQHNDIQHNDVLYKGLSDSQHNDIQHNNTVIMMTAYANEINFWSEFSTSEVAVCMSPIYFAMKQKGIA